MMDPVPLEDKDMNSSRWKHWVESGRNMPVVKLNEAEITAYEFTRSASNPFDVTQPCPYDGPVLVTCNIGANEVFANGVSVWGKFTSTCPTYIRTPRGIGAIILPDIKQGENVRWVECWGTGAYSYYVFGYTKMWLTFERLRDAVAGASVRLPPHPRLETEDRRWVDHWTGVYGRIEQEYSGDSAQYSHVDQSHLSAVASSVTTLVTVTSTKSGMATVCANCMGWSVTKYAGATTTFTVKVNGVTVGTRDIVDSGTINKDLWCDMTVLSVSVNEGDVVTLERSTSNSLTIDAHLSVWHLS